uniref:LRRCT domain-containing protein n=1 Tax=Erpetoichthys calabaricus TaxID=27687 RepID=A0A8C4RY08_ERPCA
LPIKAYTEALLLLLAFGSCQSECPINCTCNDEGMVLCLDGSLVSVPATLPPNTTVLFITNSQVRELAAHSFNGLPTLWRLQLNGNKIKSIDPETFTPLPYLLSLKLSANQLTWLPRGVFDSLAQLEQLFLNKNDLYCLPPGIFGSMVHLTELDLSSNHFSAFDEGIFANLSRLRVLNLGRNQLKSLPVNIFRPLSQLLELLLFSNQMEDIQANTFKTLRNLVELKLHSNLIQSLPPELFHCMPHLVNLTLSKNRLEELPPQTFFHLVNLTQLTIFENPLRELPPMLFGNMPHMKEFFLSSTDLPTIPAHVFNNMSGLEQLYITLNKRLTVLPKESFRGLSQLKNLKLHTNSLETLEEQLLAPLVNLQTLILHDNQLHSLPSNILQGLSQLTTIDLSNNMLPSLPKELLDSATALQDVQLVGNPWVCNCNILGFVFWLQTHQDKVHNSSALSCSSLGPLHGEVLLKVPMRLVCRIVYSGPKSPVKAPTSTVGLSVPSRSTLFYTPTHKLAATTPLYSSASLTSTLRSGNGQTLQTTLSTRSQSQFHSRATAGLPSRRGAMDVSQRGLLLWVFPVKVPYGRLYLFVYVFLAAFQFVLLVGAIYILCKILQLRRQLRWHLRPVILISVRCKNRE